MVPLVSALISLKTFMASTRQTTVSGPMPAPTFTNESVSGLGRE